MIKKKIIAICIVFIAAIIPLLTLGILSVSNTYIFSRNLTVKMLDNAAPPLIDDDWLFELYDRDVHFGELVFKVDYRDGIVTKVTFDTSNTLENYVVDSIVLRFSSFSSGVTHVYLKANYPAVPTTFTHDRYGTTIRLDGMEVYRGGSAPIEFMIESYNEVNLSISADVTYHDTSLLQLTSLKAHVSINTEIKTN